MGVEKVKEARLETLMMDFDRLKMQDNETIDGFVGRISEISTKTASLGKTIEANKLVRKFLNCLPRSKYIHMVASIEQWVDLDTVSFKEIIGRIKVFEERTADHNVGEDRGKLMYVATPNQNRGGYGGHHGDRTSSNQTKETGGQGRGSNSSRGRGKGRGRGRGRSNGQTRENSGPYEKEKKDMSKIRCWRCDKYGHYVNQCPSRPPKDQEANLNETEEADGLYMHEVVFLNEDKVFPKNYENCRGDELEWYLDNGASNHMTGNREFFYELNENLKGKVRFGDGSHVNIIGKGSICFIDKTGKKDLVSNIYYIPDLKHNILSLGQATENGCEVNMKGAILELKDSHGRQLAMVTRSVNRLYKTPMQVIYPSCMQIQCDDLTKVWHARLGHVSYGVMKNMAARELVQGLPQVLQGEEICSVCQIGKQTRTPFPAQTKYRAKKALELVHGDLCGPISPPTPSNNRYVFVLIDDFSRYMWTLLLREKSEAFNQFKRYKDYIEKQTQLKIKTFRTDRGGEFNSIEFNKFCEDNGIQRHFTAPYTPQQNGVVERRNRTLMEMTRSLLKGMKIPNTVWGEAVRHATYIINRVSTKALSGLTPYECFNNRKPNMLHIRIFGCIAYAKINDPSIKKLDDRARTAINLGTEPGSDTN